MADPCADARERADEALREFADAIDDRDEAEDELDDAESFFHESTWANLVTSVGVATACASNPIGWSVCGLGMLVGAASVTSSEVGRAGDIEAAEKALRRAERELRQANDRFQRAMREEAHCRLHNQLN